MIFISGCSSACVECSPWKREAEGSNPFTQTKDMGVSNKAMLVLAADCKSVPEKASCSIQHTPTKLAVDICVLRCYVNYIEGDRDDTQRNTKLPKQCTS